MNLSVVLPVFNGEATIARSIDSILAQTFEDFELLVVDDGSTDATASLVNGFADHRIKLIQIPHGGVANAANEGTRAALAPIIARMDADDFAHPKRFEKQLELMKATDCDVVGCQVLIVDQSGKSVDSMKRYENWINLETNSAELIAALRFVEFPLVNPTIMAKREYFELQFSDNGFPEDYDLMLRAAGQGMEFGKVLEPLLEWVENPEGLTRTDPRYSLDAFMNCRRHHFLAGPLSGHQVVDLWGLGKTGKPWARWLKEKGIEVRHAYEISERKIGNEILGLNVRSTEELQKADGVPIVIAVGSDRAREIIWPQLEANGYRVGGDAWFVA